MKSWKSHTHLFRYGSRGKLIPSKTPLWHLSVHLRLFPERQLNHHAFLKKVQKYRMPPWNSISMRRHMNRQTKMPQTTNSAKHNVQWQHLSVSEASLACEPLYLLQLPRPPVLLPTVFPSAWLWTQVWKVPPSLKLWGTSNRKTVINK